MTRTHRTSLWAWLGRSSSAPSFSGVVYAQLLARVPVGESYHVSTVLTLIIFSVHHRQRVFNFSSPSQSILASGRR
eukprot:COSAG02_NODE_3634_length_6446_cov_3.541201_9_plen_76_part_00